MPTNAFTLDEYFETPLRTTTTRDWIMDLLDEALIERYVRFRDTLTNRDIDRAERLLQTSAAAQGLAEFFQSFYREYDSLNPSSATSSSGDKSNCSPPLLSE